MVESSQTAMMSVRLPTWLLERLKRVADEVGVDHSRLIRRLIVIGLADILRRGGKDL